MWLHLKFSNIFLNSFLNFSSSSKLLFLLNSANNSFSKIEIIFSFQISSTSIDILYDFKILIFHFSKSSSTKRNKYSLEIFNKFVVKK